jgi:hypothetical protein
MFGGRTERKIEGSGMSKEFMDEQQKLACAEAIKMLQKGGDFILIIDDQNPTEGKPGIHARTAIVANPRKVAAFLECLDDVKVSIIKSSLKTLLGIMEEE